MNQGHRLRGDVKWGLGWAAWVATLFSLYVIVMALAGRPTQWPIWQVLLGCWAAAASGGVSLGLLRPAASRRAGSFLVGVVVAVCVYGIVGVVLYGFVAWVWWVALAASLAFGGLAIVVHDGNRFVSGVSSMRVLVYAIVLLLAVVLLWLDVRFHIINK